MRRVVVSALAGLVGILLAGGAASAADPSPTPAASDAPTYKAGEPVCTITDAKLIGLSGLIATDTGFVTITDSYTDKSAIKIWFLDQSCKLQKSVSYPTAPFDPEDMAMGKDGTIWVADIGDNYGERQPPAGRGIALWKLPPNSTTPQIFRYSYPDSAHDAETLLLAADDSPIFVTKNSQGSKVYVPTAPPDPSGKAVPLKEVGSFTPQHTGTPNSLSVVGNTFVTGGANSPDRKRVAIRTYSDAYEWDVPDGDVVKAITTGTPRITPLPNETNGEGIAYSPDGKLFYTIEDIEIPPIRTPILKYTPKAAPVGGPKAPATGAKSGGGGIPLSLSQITYLVAGVGVFGLLLLAGGVFGIMRSRKNRKRRDDDWDDDYDNGEWDDDRGGRQPARSGSYGRGRGASGHGPNGAPRDYGAGGAPRDYGAGGAPRDYGAGGAPRDYGAGGGYGGFPPGPGGFPPPAPTYGTAAPAGGAVYGGRGGGGAGGTVYGGGGGQGAYQEPYPQGYQQPGYDQGYYDQGYYDQGYQDPGYQDPAYQDPGYHGNGYADQGYYSDQQPDGYQDRRR